ncbi:XPA [Branchiostoma lanceolatum]|uniref:XPA protein n=1 Tax=Branchiostoma lanceolatum TaxID=7740 RepID=A0A8K0EJQ9_BRALA|nr:XPA [Branchiostoma lanceolatum]
MAATTEAGSGANVQPAMTPESPPEPLSDAQRAKIERNRQRALLLRQARLSSRPYTDPSDRPRGQGKSSQGKLPGRVIDSGAGFLIEEDEEGEDPTAKIKVVHRPGPILEPDRVACELCNKEISDSFLFNSFDVPVCDGCKDMEEKHKLITKTEAKQEFLLKDCDFDQRDPPLKCIIRKNPHNQRWGDMKLFLFYQVKINLKYNTVYSVSPKVPARPWDRSPKGQRTIRPAGGWNRGIYREFTLLYFIHVIPTHKTPILM